MHILRTWKRTWILSVNHQTVAVSSFYTAEGFDNLLAHFRTMFAASASTRYTTPYLRTERVMWPDSVPFRGAQRPSHRKPRHMSYSYEGQTYGNWDASARNHELDLPSRRKTTNRVNMRNIKRGQNMYQPANRLEQTYHPSLSSTSSWLATPNLTVPLPRVDYRPFTEPSATLPGFINKNANTIPRISHEYS